MNYLRFRDECKHFNITFWIKHNLFIARCKKLPSVQFKPWYPLSHPFIHVPLMGLHCSYKTQFPQGMLQFSPYFLPSHSVRKA